VDGRAVGLEEIGSEANERRDVFDRPEGEQGKQSQCPRGFTPDDRQTDPEACQTARDPAPGEGVTIVDAINDGVELGRVEGEYDREGVRG
jgi:hypothetical protein